MRSLFLAVALGFSTLAAAADTQWAADETVSTRFPDSATPGPTFAKGARLTVLVEEGDRVRVRSASGYGWIAKAALTDEEPEGGAQPMPTGTFDLESLKGLLEPQ